MNAGENTRMSDLDTRSMQDGALSGGVSVAALSAGATLPPIPRPPLSPQQAGGTITEAFVGGQKCRLLSLQGEIDFASAPYQDRYVRQAFTQAGAQPVVLDLRKVTFLDSVGLTVLVRFCSQERARSSAVSRPERIPGYPIRSRTGETSSDLSQNEGSVGPIHPNTNTYRPMILVNRGSQVERLLSLSQFDQLFQVRSLPDGEESAE
jgi:anti-anti-sigma regulatory factor